VLKNTKEVSLKQLAKRHINVLKRLSQWENIYFL
jgi:hypothetical protein